MTELKDLLNELEKEEKINDKIEKNLYRQNKKRTNSSSFFQGRNTTSLAELNSCFVGRTH